MTAMYLVPGDREADDGGLRYDHQDNGGFLVHEDSRNASNWTKMVLSAGNLSANFEHGISTSRQEYIILGDLMFILERYITPLVCVIGFLGNVLNLAILSRSRFRQTDGHCETGAHIGLIYMAVSDLVLCIALFPRALVNPLHVIFDSYDFLLLYQTYSTGVITTLILISTWITVDMTLMRYFYICHPFRSRNWNSRKFAMVMYPISSLLCVSLNIPLFFELQVVKFTDMGDESTKYMIDIGLLGMYPKGKLMFEWARIILGIIIPAIILLYCNFCLIKALRRSHRVRLQSYVKDTNSQRSRKWITVTLILISVGFIALVFPSELMNFFTGFIKSNRVRTEAFLIARCIFNTLQVANFALNFVLYCIINVHFRMALGDLCRCLLPKVAANGSQPSSNISAGSVYSSRRVRMSNTKL